MLTSQFKDDQQKSYSVSLRREGSALPIPVCMSFHMLCFQHDGSVLAKTNLCSYDDCLLGNFLQCSIERGLCFNVDTEEDDSDSDSDDEYEGEDDFGDDIEDDNLEKYELRSETVLEVLEKGSVVALFSPSNSLELFKVIDFGVATEDLTNGNNHCIGNGSSYILVTLLRKKAQLRI